MPLAQPFALPLAEAAARGVDPLWARTPDGPDPGRWSAAALAELDARARSCPEIGGFARGGALGAALALMAASEASPLGLRLRDAEPQSEPPSHVYRSGQRHGLPARAAARSRLAAALRLWRAAREAGLGLAPGEPQTLAEALFGEERWDAPERFGLRHESAAGGRGGWSDGPRYACAPLVALFLAEARRVGGEAALGEIMASFFRGFTRRNRWNDRAWLLAGPECAPFLPLSLQTPCLGEAAKIRSRLEPPGSRQAPGAQPLALAWIESGSFDEWSACARLSLAARWRGVDWLSPDPAAGLSSRAAALSLLLARRGQGINGHAPRALRAEAREDGHSFLDLLAVLLDREPSLAGEHPLGSLLWVWADGLPGDAPAEGPVDPELCVDIGWGSRAERLMHDRAGLFRHLLVGRWLSSFGASPSTPGPDGLSPLRKLRGCPGHESLLALWESAELARDAAPAAARLPAGAPQRRL
jgi:hypothetical protein